MIEVKWHDAEQTIVRLDYFEPVESWDEYHKAVKEAYNLVRSKTYKVNVIHIPGKAQMPGGNAFAELRRVVETAPANTGHVYMVVSNMFARRMTEMMLKLTLGAKDYHFVKSVEDALSHIETLKPAVH